MNKLVFILLYGIQTMVDPILSECKLVVKVTLPISDHTQCSLIQDLSARIVPVNQKVISNYIYLCYEHIDSIYLIPTVKSNKKKQITFFSSCLNTVSVDFKLHYPHQTLTFVLYTKGPSISKFRNTVFN